MLKNMKLRPRMLLSYVLIIAISMMASITALVMLRGVGADLTKFYENNFAVTVDAWTARRSIYAAMSDLLQGIQETDKAATQKFIDDANAELGIIYATLPLIKEKSAKDTGLVDEINTILANTDEYRKEIIALSLAFKNEEAYAIMKNNYVPELDRVREILKQITEDTDIEAQAMVANAQNSVTISIAIVVAIMLVSVLLAIVLGLYIANSVRKPVAEIEAAAKNLAAGNLVEARVNYESRDELGGLASSMRDTVAALSGMINDIAYLMGTMAEGNFNVHTKNEAGYVGDFKPILLSIRSMNASLSDTLSQINQASDQVAIGSDQVSSGAQALSQGATEQASSVQELAATITEISSQVKQSAENAKLADSQAGGVSAEAAESSQRMQDMLSAMGDISGSSSEIGKIIKTIEDIAFQTNILALNAAVEAARAGAAGKGFAVVADEVRNLANKSQEASKNTAALIEGSLRSVERGTKIANETAQSLTTVVSGVSGASITIRKIAEASVEQASSINQVTQGVDQIAAVVQTNSATAEQSAAASEQLSGQAQMLKALVSRFRLRDDAMASSPQPAEPMEYAPPEDYKYTAGAGKY